MKRLNLFFIIYILTYFVSQSQATFEENGILYMEDLSDPTKLAVVVVQKTSPMDPENSIYSGSIIIPAYIEHDMDKYEVVGIAPMAFKGEKLEELVIEEGPTNVGNWAFYNSSLRKLTYPGSLKELPNLYSPVLEELNIGEGVVEINEVFDGNQLRKINFPKSLETIKSCILHPLDLTLSLGPNISEISQSFVDLQCKNLDIKGQSATISNSFVNCASLQNIKLSGISKIETSFMACPVENLDLGTIEMLSESFVYGGMLEELIIPITCKQINNSFNSLKIGGIRILSSERIIDSFNNLDNLKELTIPKTCKEVIGSFTHIDSLEVLKIEEGVESIKDSFKGADNLKILYIPSFLSLDLSLPNNYLQEVHLTYSTPTKECPDYIRRTVSDNLKVFVPQKAAENYLEAWRGVVDSKKIEFIEE